MDKNADNSKIAHCDFCGFSIEDLKDKEEATLFGNLEGNASICSNCIDSFSFDLDFEMSNKEREGVFTFDKKPHDIVKELNENIIGQDKVKKTLALAAYQHYKRIVDAQEGDLEDDTQIDKSNILLVGPTGSGKTLIAKNLANALNVPFYIARATSITEAGFMGDDVESIIEGLLEKADMNVELAEKGIVFIDEIDKIARSADSGQSKDPSGLGTQNSLLTILEDDEIIAFKKHDFKEPVKVNTKNILFIASGAFSGINEIVSKRLKNKGSSIGVLANLQKQKDDQEFNMAEITTEDFVKFGLVPEFVGRFPIITSLKGLTKDDMVQVITGPKNSILNQYKKMFLKENTLLKIEEDALTEIAAIVVKNKTGARGLRGIFNSLFEDALFEATKNKSKKIVSLTKDHVINNKPADLKLYTKEKVKKA